MLCTCEDAASGSGDGKGCDWIAEAGMQLLEGAKVEGAECTEWVDV